MGIAAPRLTFGADDKIFWFDRRLTDAVAQRQ
jgi:hypothetical protein